MFFKKRISVEEYCRKNLTQLGGVSFLFGWAWLIFKPAREDARPTD